MPEQGQEKIKKKRDGRANSDHVREPERGTGEAGDSVDGKPHHLDQIEFRRTGIPFGPIVFYSGGAKADPAYHPAQVHNLVTHGKQAIERAATHEPEIAAIERR